MLVLNVVWDDVEVDTKDKSGHSPLSHAAQRGTVTQVVVKLHTVCNILLYLIMYYIALLNSSELMGQEETCDIAQSHEDDWV